MRSRSLAILCGLCAALAVTLGCAAAPPPAPPPPPPPPPPPTAAAPACLTLAILTYDPANAASPFKLDQKPINVPYPEQNASQWGICWTLVVKGPDPDPFDQIRLDRLSDVNGQGNRPVLLGDTNFKGKQFAWVFFNDEPNWGAGDEVKIEYDVVARLKGATSNLAVDPDIIIQKPRT